MSGGSCPAGSFPVEQETPCAPVSPEGPCLPVDRTSQREAMASLSERSERDRPVMSDAGRSVGRSGWLDDDQVDPDRERRQCGAARNAVFEQPTDRGSQMGPFPVVERLLRQPEVAPAARPDLDHDEGGRRSRIEREEIELAPAGADLPSEDRPAEILELAG